MKLTLIDGNAVTIRVIGRYDFRHVSMIADELDDMLHTNRIRKVTVDLSHTTSVSAAGVRQLVCIQKCVGQKFFRIISPNTLVSYAFIAAALGNVFGLSKGDD